MAAASTASDPVVNAAGLKMSFDYDPGMPVIKSRECMMARNAPDDLINEVRRAFYPRRYGKIMYCSFDDEIVVPAGEGRCCCWGIRYKERTRTVRKYFLQFELVQGLVANSESGYYCQELVYYEERAGGSPYRSSDYTCRAEINNPFPARTVGTDWAELVSGDVGRM